MNKFKLQTIGTLSVLIILIVSILAALNYISFRDESVHLHKELLRQQNITTNARLSQQFEGIRNMLSTVNTTKADVMDSHLSARTIIQLKALQRGFKGINDNVRLVTRDGGLYNDDGQKMSLNVKTHRRPYYNAVFNEGKTFYVTPVYTSKLTGNPIVGIILKINNFSAVLTTIKTENVLKSITDQQNMFVYDHHGVIIKSPYSEMMNKNIQDVRPLYKTFSVRTPELTYIVNSGGNNIRYTAFWGEMAVTGWNYVSFIPNSEFEKGANQQLVSATITGIISLVFAVIVLLLILNQLVIRPVGGAPDEIAALMETMASGDLTQDLNSNGKETGIYLSLVNLTNQLSSLIKNSHGISENVSSAAQELNVVMSDTQNNAQGELQQIEQVSTAIHELSSTSQEVSNKAVMAEDEARKSQANVEKGKCTLESNIALINRINISVNESAEIVEQLSNFVSDIGSVTDVINNIADQTNLLALNAAIEAARAGEYGRGFAVVADEVRSLATRTQESTVNIHKIIEKLQTQSTIANKNMQRNVELIDESVLATANVTQAFEEIATATRAISEINALVATASQQQYAVTEEISVSTTHTFDLVNRNVAAIHQTLQASSELAQLAESLKSELQWFRV